MMRRALLVMLAAGCSTSAPVAEAPIDVAPQARVELEDTGFAVTAQAVSIEAVAPEEVGPAAERTLSPPVEHPAPRFALRRGESLAHFARWSGVPVEDVAEASGLELAGIYPVGTEIFVPGADVAVIERERVLHEGKRLTDYLASRGGAIATEELRVRTGDSAWAIARDQVGVPVWVIEAYNPTVDLEALRPGQALEVPVLADIVVDAGE